MTAEELAIARRLVACKGWRWLPGMMDEDGGRFVQRESPSSFRFIGPRRGQWHLIHGTPLPDLSDPLTRLGVLQVVRDAHDDQSIGITKAGDEWAVTRSFTLGDNRMAMTVLRSASTEAKAMLSAMRVLEATP